MSEKPSRPAAPLTIDPSCFEDSRVDAETNRTNELLEQLLATPPGVLDARASEVRFNALPASLARRGNAQLMEFIDRHADA